MAGGREPRKTPPRKPVRLHDSGFASDDDHGVPSPDSDSSDSAVGSSPPVRALELPTLRQTNWDFGTPRSRYARDGLNLYQPDSFPIIPLASTLARAREEAEAEVVARGYNGPDFSIYEDTIEEEDALPEIVVTATTDDTKVIDSRGRTRAASKRLGLGPATPPEEGLSEDKENTTQAGKKRKRGGAQASKQPRKQAKKVTQDAEPV